MNGKVKIIIVDVDECHNGADTCDSNALCTNTAGSFRCSCIYGFTGDGQNCTGSQRP